MKIAVSGNPEQNCRRFELGPSALAMCFGMLILGGMCSAAANSGVIPVTNRLKLEPDREPRTERHLKAHLKQLMTDPENPLLHMQIGIDYLSLATPDHWEYIDYAANYFERAAAMMPNDPIVLMYRGRALGARALNIEPSTLKRLKWARDGFREMDKAVSMDPKNAILRLLRGEAQLLAHPILRRGGKLDEDARYIETFMEKSAYQSLPDYQKARIQLFLGNYSDRKKRSANLSRAHWRSASLLAANTPVGREAQARLEGKFVNIGYEGD